MNRVVVLIILVATSLVNNVYAQGFMVDNNDYLQVSSYEGAKANNLFLIRISGVGVLNLEKGWSIGVTAMPKVNNGNIFPPDKVFIEPHSLTGSNDTPPFPTINQIGINPITYLKNNSEVLLVSISPTKLENGKNYYNFEIRLNYGVFGGSYLDNLKGKSIYLIVLRFTLYDSLGNPIKSFDFKTRIEVMGTLTGIPPTENNFSLQISNEAKEGLLEVKSTSDYINGVSVVYSDALKVSSNSNYQITVKSQSPYFVSKTSDTLPLDIVNVNLNPTSYKGGILSEVKLSTSPQILLKGTSTNSIPIFFDLKYRTQFNDGRLFKSKSDNYKTTLTYEMTVQ